jgi:hypothetical protein
VADSRSRDVFFVAVCRCFGIPARLKPATYLPQYWNGNSWQNIAFEPVKENISERDRFTLSTEPGFQSQNMPSISPLHAIATAFYRSV